jgi:hypothetical protein
MALTFGLTSIRDLLAKLQRDAAALDNEVTRAAGSSLDMQHFDLLATTLKTVTT